MATRQRRAYPQPAAWPGRALVAQGQRSRRGCAAGMGGLRQERVGGGRTNVAASAERPPSSSGSRPSTAGSRPSSSGSRPSTAGARRPLPAPLDASSRPQHDFGPGAGSRPTSAPASRPSTAGSGGRPPRPWQHAEETGGQGQPAPASAPGFEGVARTRVKRDELFGSSSPGSAHASVSGGSSRGSSRPGTASSRASRASRDGIPPRARPGSAPVQRQNEDQRPATTSSMDSETSSACEERLLTFQKYFQDKNFAKFSQLKVSFRPCRLPAPSPRTRLLRLATE